MPLRPSPCSTLLALGLLLGGCVELPDPLPPYPGAFDGALPDGAYATIDTGPSIVADALADGAPSPLEICNGLDDDADDAIDEIAPLMAPETRAADDPSLCRPLITRCEGGVSRTTPDRFEAQEVSCDGLDNDCDGAVDEQQGLPCIWCDGVASAPPCNGCPGRTVVPPAFACIPAGRFTMGSPGEDRDRDEDEGPLHEVVLERPYLLSATEMTQGRWRGVLGDALPENPSWFSNVSGGGACHEEESGRCPMERVSWYDAVWLANLISSAEGRSQCYGLADCRGEPMGGCSRDEPTCMGGYVCDAVDRIPGCTGYRLPTEAEWERAARGGNNNRYWSGDTTADLGRADVFRSNSDGRPRPFVLGEVSSPFGLRDVHGNVAEWVFDSYAPYPDPPMLRVNPVVDGPEQRVSRAGSWDATFAECRSASREGINPEARSATRGLRLALDAAAAPYETASQPEGPPGG